MSVWGDIRRCADGKSVRQEDQMVKDMENKILELVQQANSLVTEINHIADQGMRYEKEMYVAGGTFSLNYPINHPDMDMINEVLASKNYDRMTSLNFSLISSISGLVQRKNTLQKRLQEAMDREQERIQELNDWIEAKNKEEKEREMEECKKQDTRDVIIFIISLVIGLVIGITSTIDLYKSGESWGFGIGLGILAFLFSLGLFNGHYN